MAGRGKALSPEDKDKKIEKQIETELPEHVPVIPLDIEIERKKEEARKKAVELRKKQTKVEPIIITEDEQVKKVSELTFQEQEVEILRCGIDPIYFIETYLTIFDQTQGDGGKLVPFKLFDFQKDLINDYQNNRFNVVNKYRQAGISTCSCAYAAWYIMFNENRSLAIIANKLETAKDELMYDVIEFINGCPVFLKPKTGKDTENNLKDTQKLKRYDNGSTIAAFSSKGLRGYSPTLLIWDEVAWTEKSGVFWTASYPTLQTGGGAILISTPSGMDEVFYKTFMGARRKENNFNNVEIWWFNDPRYNKFLVWLKNKGKTNEIKLVDEDWTKEHRLKLMEDGWEASSPWFEDQVRNSNGDMRRIAQELLCVGASSLVTLKHKTTNKIDVLTISNLYQKIKDI